MSSGSRGRLQKLLAGAGVASRRGAEDLIRSGRVTLNGVPATLGQSADLARDVVAVDGRRVEPEPLVYWLVHKPKDVLTTVRDTHGRRTVLDLVPEREARVFPVGRLDRDTEGLVLLTNDGALAQVLLHPSHETEREYLVTVRGRVSAQAFRRLERGLEIDGAVTAPAKVADPRHDERRGTTRFSLTLIEGRKRQIRLAMRALGHPVVRLVRVRMGPLRLGRLATGKARRVTPRERRDLLRLLG